LNLPPDEVVSAPLVQRAKYVISWSIIDIE